MRWPDTYCDYDDTETRPARRIILRAIEESDVPTPGDARGANPGILETARPERGAVGRGIDSRNPGFKIVPSIICGPDRRQRAM